MNCRRMEDLIPLYVGGDLAGDANDAASSHLSRCPRCNQLAVEYEESRQWLRMNGAPSLDTVFFESLKRATMIDIERLSEQRTLFGSIIRDWNGPAVLVAAALVVFFIGGAALFYYYGVKRSLQHSVVASGPAENPIERRTPDNNARDMSKSRNERASVSRMTARSAIVASLQPGDFAQSDPLDEPGTDYSSNQFASEVEAVPGLEPVAAEPAPDDTMRDLLRIEIQTSDPSIRIIWFVPREDEARPPKSTLSSH
ncbi:MAG TPA: zf-HC2 domain-containing protein [Blastocatellia bacterium]|nr:zf-HC2 domain-containing protein [Blastocatellia bacterium]